MGKNLDVLYNGEFCYQIKISDDFNNLKQYLLDNNAKKYNKICIVSDDKVADFYLHQIEDLLENNVGYVSSFVFASGEASKNLDTVDKLYEHLINEHFDRHDCLIALGGGVVGDLTGFTASTYLRGIDFIQVPTSLLSFVDSSIGGKTGVDFKGYKNMVGAFYMPKLVCINTSVLKTLDDEQFSCGMGEVIKHGLIRDKSYYKWLLDNSQSIMDKDPGTLEEMIYLSCGIKKAVVEEDPKEQGIRAYLNFGHTIGHAVEKLLDYKYYHGQCVSLGMVSAMYLSLKEGLVTEEDYQLLLDTLQAFNLPITLKGDQSIPNLSSQQILEATKSDKKMVGNKVKFVLLDGIGNAFINMDLSNDDLIEGIEKIL